MLVEFHWNFLVCSFISGLKQKDKTSFERENSLPFVYHRRLANENLVLVFDYTFFPLLQMMFYQK